MSKTKMKIEVRQARIDGARSGFRVVYLMGKKVVATSGVLSSHKEVRLNIAALKHQGFSEAVVENHSTADIDLQGL